MSKIMKRPLFRKGGNVGDGIMTNIRPRQGYNLGNRVQERMDLLNKYAGGRSSTVLPNFLIQSGLNLIQGTGEDRGMLREVASAVQDPLKTATAGKQREDMFRRQLGLAAAQGVIGEDQATRLAMLKSRYGRPTNYQSMLNNELIKQFGQKKAYTDEEMKSAIVEVNKFVSKGKSNYADDLTKLAKTYEDTPNPGYAAEIKLKHRDKVTVLTDVFYDLKKGTLDEEILKTRGRPGVTYFDTGSMKFLQVVKDPNTNVIKIVEVAEPATQ